MKTIVCKDTIGEIRYKVYHITAGKSYKVKREDNIVYYIRNDLNELCEVLKDFFDDISYVRNEKIDSILEC